MEKVLLHFRASRDAFPNKATPIGKLAIFLEDSVVSSAEIVSWEGEGK
jgi:hypothetical protein